MCSALFNGSCNTHYWTMFLSCSTSRNTPTCVFGRWFGLWARLPLDCQVLRCSNTTILNTDMLLRRHTTANRRPPQGKRVLKWDWAPKCAVKALKVLSFAVVLLAADGFHQGMITSTAKCVVFCKRKLPVLCPPRFARTLRLIWCCRRRFTTGP